MVACVPPVGPRPSPPEEAHVGEPHENLEVVFVAWLEAIRRGEPALAAARLAPDVVWQGVAPHLRCEGRAEVVEAITARIAAGAPRVRSLELEAAGDRVVLGVVSPDLDRAGDVALAGRIHIVFTVRDGLITAVHDHRDRGSARREAGLEA